MSKNFKFAFSKWLEWLQNEKRISINTFDAYERDLTKWSEFTSNSNNPKKKDFRIGEKFYFTSGLCGPESSKECVGQPRNIVVDNLPGRKKNNEGLIPSIIGDFGAMDNYSSLPELAKYIMMFGMILGRLEIFAVLVLFTKTFWRS